MIGNGGDGRNARRAAEREGTEDLGTVGKQPAERKARHAGQQHAPDAQGRRVVRQISAGKIVTVEKADAAKQQGQPCTCHAARQHGTFFGDGNGLAEIRQLGRLYRRDQVGMGLADFVQNLAGHYANPPFVLKTDRVLMSRRTAFLRRNARQFRLS